MKITYLPIGFLVLTFMVSCNLEKEVQIDLPEYKSRLVVECYLEPNRTYSLLLTRSAPYFETFPGSSEEFIDQTLVDDAEVYITYNGDTIEMQNQLIFNPFTQKIFNYHTEATVPEDYSNDFNLYVRTKDNEVLTATTHILEPVSIDSVVIQFAESDTLARVLTYFTDNPSQENYYRRMLHLNNLDSIPEQDFISDDRFVEDVVVFGTNYNFAEGEQVVNTLYHINRNYFEFLESIENALNANGNPFGQPSPILSNIQGDGEPLGIFTGISYDRVQTKIER